MEVPCTGYWGPIFSGGQGEQKRLLQSCSELARQRGGFLGEGADKECPACHNSGRTTAEEIATRTRKAQAQF